MDTLGEEEEQNQPSGSGAEEQPQWDIYIIALLQGAGTILEGGMERVRGQGGLCFLAMTGPLQTPSWGAVHHWWLLEGRESVFFKGGAPTRSTTLQWMVTLSWVYSKHQLDSMKIKLINLTQLKKNKTVKEHMKFRGSEKVDVGSGRS